MGEAARRLNHDLFPDSVPLLSTRQIRPCLDNLDTFIKRYGPAFYRVEQAGHARTVLEGLLSDLPRKTLEPIAIDHGQHRRPIQHFVGAGRWDDERVLAVMHPHVVEGFGDPRGVLVLDPSGFPKKGTESVGVQRQWCGRLGKVENCQLGVFLAYVSGHGGCLVDRELYLPRSWTRSPKRRQKTHIPRRVRYRSTVQIGDDLLKKDGARFPHAWITGDDEFGRVTWFRYTLADRGERYLLEVPGNTSVRDLEANPPRRPRHRRGPAHMAPFVPVSEWAKAQPAHRWTRFHVRDGEKGPIELEAIRCAVQARHRRRVGREETVLVTRSLDSIPEYKFWLAPPKVEAPLAEMVWAGSMRHRVEEMIQWAKGDAGLAHYEVRSWVGWRHHMTMSLLAQFFLTLEHQRIGGKNPRDHGVDGRQGRRLATA